MFRSKALSIAAFVALFIIRGGLTADAADAPTPAVIARVEAALQNMAAINRPGRVGYAAFWDGNSFVQCRRTQTRELRCEAAGTLMQPSLKRVLSPERLERLDKLGWKLEPSFGNYVQVFSADIAPNRAALHILNALLDGYDAQASAIDVETRWVADVACPPRNGMSQNRAGIVNDDPAMRATALNACAFSPSAALDVGRTFASIEDLIDNYGATVTAEIQRLRVNASRRVYVVFGVGIGYVQCSPQVTPSSIYCEAQSAESWPALGAVLNADRIEILRAAGYADPGRTPNYWKAYPSEKYDDAAIAREALTILHLVYGYNGAPKLKILTE